MWGLVCPNSRHQSYSLWGPRDYTGEGVIVMQGNQHDLKRRFASVQKVASVFHPYSMPSEHFNIYYCRGLRQPLKELWPQIKNWD